MNHIRNMTLGECWSKPATPAAGEPGSIRQTFASIYIYLDLPRRRHDPALAWQVAKHLARFASRRAR